MVWRQAAAQTCNAWIGDTYIAEYTEPVEMVESVSKSDASRTRDRSRQTTIQCVLPLPFR